MKEDLKIRPYARLLSMLGDQLIKNELVALTELIKNSYDADADKCNVKFEGFDENNRAMYGSRIIVEDDGNGMSYDIITKHFLNPATPIKKINKEKRQSKKGRICQGEKGIGRFSMLKLGRKVTIYSKEYDKQVIHKVVFDFTKYDDEFLTELEKSKEIFLDQIVINYETVSIDDLPIKSLIKVKDQGTIIEIEGLKGNWGEEKLNQLKKDMIRFTPFEVDEEKIVENMDFSVDIFINNQLIDYKTTILKDIKDIVYHKALYKIRGEYNEYNKVISFVYEEGENTAKNIILYLDCKNSPNRQTTDFKGLKIYRDDISKFYKNDNNTECGDFKFQFYIFNFSANQHDPYGLNDTEKEIIRDHRVFLYRDNIRVQPYGAPDDDWLQIDRKRAADKAGNMFSNDQLFGQIKITQKGNVKLKDKTSREGIIEDSDAFTQLITLVRGLLSYIRTKIYQNYLFNEKKKKEEKEIKKEKVENKFIQLQVELQDNPKSLKLLQEIEQSYNRQEEVYNHRLDTAERLAGVGLSVEAASHDIMLTIDRLKDNIHQTYIDTSSPMFADLSVIHKNAEAAEGMIGLVYMKMKDLQQLFVSSKQRPKLTNVIDIVKKIQSIYSKQYEENNIKVEYEIVGSPVKAKIIDAVLFQVFINLFDNALYWLQYIDKDRKVKIKFDGFSQTVIFSDNGVGVSGDDAPYIFEAFYSGKGEDGRGLGLYIAKKLLNRSCFDINLVENFYQKIQCGANFELSFVSEVS